MPDPPSALAALPASPRVVALLPMRHGSERVAGKNHRPLGGMPLYQHVLRTLLEVRGIDEVVVDTDSPPILEEAARLFPRVRLLERPEPLRGGLVPMNDVLAHDVALCPADLYLQTHSTNPLLRPATVERALAQFLAGWPEHDSLFGVTRLQTRLYDAGGHALNHDPRVLLRTQDLPPVFEENSCLYVFTGAGLRRHGSRIGARPRMFEIPREEAWDIDEELDFAVAEFLWRRRDAPRP
jgi:CMP-N-acetylneuraminic acid synthetase